MPYKTLRPIADVQANLKTLPFRSLLSDPLDNPKVNKAHKLGVSTAPLHLAPARLSGFNVCAQSTPECRAACLHTAGMPFALAAKERARIARTQFLFKNRAQFMALLIGEIQTHVARVPVGMKPAVRLNATSDVMWEAIRVTFAGVEYRNIMEMFPNVQFYDYTKITKRAIAAAQQAPRWPANYHLTFSLTESNDSDARKVLEAGGNVAVVFDSPHWTRAGRVRATKPLPRRYTLAGYDARVIDADQHDYRPADGHGVICGLRAKGKAIGNALGFVRHCQTGKRKGPVRARVAA